ncbi:MAG TPA: rhomboid family intramembrane serine protease [Vicinamibacterales bacterium]|nr:rhomboid family intramembrane serine protease [Vicinamibacterales bacterium]
MIPIKDVIPSRTWPGVTISIVVVNVAVFLYQTTLPQPALEAFIYARGLVPADFSVVAMVTSMFVHGGFGHVAGNLLYLWIFGDNVEDRLGHGRFVLFYLATGVIAALAQTAMDPDSTIPMVGASGAIAGVMGGYFVLYPQSRVLTLFPFPLMLFEVPAVFFLGLWFLVQFLNGLGSSMAAAGRDLPGGVAFWAHVMGFVAGVLLVRLMRRPERQRVEWWSP